MQRKIARNRGNFRKPIGNYSFLLSVHRETQGKVAGNRGNLRKPIGNRRKPLRKPFVFEEVLSENTILGHTPGSIYITKLKVGSPPPRPGACGSPTTKPARSARFFGGGRPRRPVVTIIIAIVTIIIMIVIIKAPGPARAKRRWLEPQLQRNQTPPCV